MKILNCLLVFTISFFLPSCTSQYVIKEPTKDPIEKSIREKSLIQEGINAFEHGKYQEAVKRYQEVLNSNPDNVQAIYELALTYSAMNQHKKSLEAGMRAMKYRWSELSKVYLLVGTELDYLGKQSDAIDLYEDAIKRYPNDYLLYYNLGITRLSRDEIEEAKTAFKSTVTLRPSHAGSHLALAQSFLKERNKIPALFAYCRYLILEPSGERADSARKNVLSIVAGNVKTDPNNSNQINIMSNPNEPKSEGDFRAINFFLSMNSALKLSMMKDNRSVRGRETDIFEGIFSMAGEDTSKENKSGFVRQYYIPYFSELNKRNFTGVFVDYAIYDIINSQDTVKAFLKWSEDYKWPTAIQ
jgi:tetratricopeptide (TPR) repeat protein